MFIKQVPLPIEYIEKSQRHSADLVIVNLTGEGSGAIAALVNNAIQLVKPDGRVILKGDKTSLVEAAEQFGIPPSANSEGTQPIQEAKMLAEECFLLAHVPTDACRAYLQPVNHLCEISNDSFALFVLSANPLHVTLPCTYRHPEFEHHAKEVPAVDFGTYYQNPWLYRAMVQNGERIRHEPTLLALSETVIATAAKGSADLGAALTVAGYQLLKNGELDNTGPLLAQIQEYIATNTQSGHSLRWRISLAYLAALIHAARGESQRAEAYFEKVTQEDACKFNPILTTKTISAYFWLGINHLQSGDLETAKNSFANGVRTSLRAMATNQQTTVGDPDAPLAFALQEIAEVADMGAQCAIALRHADRFSTAPASFWRRVSTRRFGQANWLMHLEAENLRLAKENVALEEAAGRQTHSQS